jgi:hypothetical protein
MRRFEHEQVKNQGWKHLHSRAIPAKPAAALRVCLRTVSANSKNPTKDDVHYRRGNTRHLPKHLASPAAERELSVAFARRH